MNKTILSTAIVAAMGITSLTTAATAQAANIISLSIADWDGDSIAGGLAFASGTSPTSKYTHFFDSTTPGSSVYLGDFTTSGNGITGGEQGFATAGVDDSFSTGFEFTGYSVLLSTLTATGNGTETVPGNGITFGAVADGDASINYTDFNWSFKLGPNEIFPVSPTGGLFSTNILTQGGACSEAIGSNTACYITRWESFIQPQAGFEGDTVWQIEGIANFDAAVTLSSVPVPAAAWLFGSGLLGMIGVARRRRNA